MSEGHFSTTRAFFQCGEAPLCICASELRPHPCSLGPGNSPGAKPLLTFLWASGLGFLPACVMPWLWCGLQHLLRVTLGWIRDPGARMGVLRGGARGGAGLKTSCWCRLYPLHSQCEETCQITDGALETASLTIRDAGSAPPGAQGQRQSSLFPVLKPGFAEGNTEV